VIRAVVFDLWDTLVDFDVAAGRAFQDQVAARLGRDPDEFAALWMEGRPARESGTLRDYLLGIGAPEDSVDEVVALRSDSTRSLLAPRPGAVETLAELRGSGYGVGLITVCSEDVPDVWAETVFADLFDATVFSCSVGLRKPDPRIYQLACSELAVAPEEAMFVGDGANDELAGAERVGMQAVLIHRQGEEPPWPEAREWQGQRITAIPQVLSLLADRQPPARDGTL
jgi:putative hydrolase of the HAD superfamily